MQDYWQTVTYTLSRDDDKKSTSNEYMSYIVKSGEQAAGKEDKMTIY